MLNHNYVELCLVETETRKIVQNLFVKVIIKLERLMILYLHRMKRTQIIELTL